VIVNLYVAVDLAIAFFALAVGSYAAVKAYKVDAAEKTAITDQRYELEKDYYLVSTVGWMTLATRILAIPLFWVTAISLIPSVTGAMCEYGVFQAGSPFSWADFGLKLFTMFAFGGWLFFDFMNRKLKGSPYIGTLSRGFVLLLPLLFADAALDIAFFAGLKPLQVQCCMVVYPTAASGFFNIGCPFCFLTYTYPLLWGVIATYALSLALTIWSFMFKRSVAKMTAKDNVPHLLSKTLVAGMALALIGTILLIAQILIGPFTSVY
jgi:hypothetical protein